MTSQAREASIILYGNQACYVLKIAKFKSVKRVVFLGGAALLSHIMLLVGISFYRGRSDTNRSIYYIIHLDARSFFDVVVMLN